MSKSWKSWPSDECPDCGSPIEIFTEMKDEGWAHDGDELRCSDPECSRHFFDLGHVTVYDYDDLAINFEPWPIGDDDRPYPPGDK